jgi:hypothetical protein
MEMSPGPASWVKSKEVRDGWKAGVESAEANIVQIRVSSSQRSVLVLLLSLSPALHHSLAGFVGTLGVDLKTPARLVLL